MTIERLSLHSEQYGSTGNIGENSQRLLGAPSLDPLQTVIREAIQNVADAALPSVGPDIRIRIRRLTATSAGGLIPPSSARFQRSLAPRSSLPP